MLLLSALLVLLGLAGMLLPALPGAPLVLVGLALAAWAEDFQHVGPGWLVLFTVLTALSMLGDFLASSLGARGFGATRRAAIGAAIGTLAGLFFLPVGLFLGPFFGAVAGELSARRSLGEAGMAGIGATLGLMLGMAIKFALAIGMIGLFLFLRMT